MQTFLEQIGEAQTPARSNVAISQAQADAAESPMDADPDKDSSTAEKSDEDEDVIDAEYVDVEENK